MNVYEHLIPAQRREVARVSLHALGAHRADHRRLDVRCSRSHHVAAVYDTSSGLVYAASAGTQAHGSRARVDTPHHGDRHGAEHVDLLTEIDTRVMDDRLPAWCGCGPRTLSRADLRRAIADGERHVQLL
ncbi:hypothetical protein ALI22I_07890 [Saccharothrix sp. ALI-22-I]|uniref:hypothetical protein n=1 Tax=Saccharothrix sp. ALI-22-I TaxID=1933778 RepID=UPI00097BCF2F|nr:hypothetical protein [Saccharothrix sp. ALI-22-I]ONI91546.1 hypothetical protein ALI22I_07890 [Saccharothrix sp. ALI-22-I]